MIVRNVRMSYCSKIRPSSSRSRPLLVKSHRFCLLVCIPAYDEYTGPYALYATGAPIYYLFPIALWTSALILQQTVSVAKSSPRHTGLWFSDGSVRVTVELRLSRQILLLCPPLCLQYFRYHKLSWTQHLPLQWHM